MIVITICTLPVTGPIPAASATFITITVAAVIVSIGSFIAWVVACGGGDARTRICPSLVRLHDILSALVVISILIAALLLLVSSHCAIAGLVDVAWFSTLLSMNWVYGSNQQYDEGIDLQSDSNCFIGVENSNVIRYFSADSFGDKGQEYFLDGWNTFGYDNSSEEANLALNTNQELESTVSCIDSGWNKPE